MAKLRVMAGQVTGLAMLCLWPWQALPQAGPDSTGLNAAELAAAQQEPHLTVLPRSAAETQRVARLTAPATQFGKPEPFEDKAGGAATVPALATAEAFSQPSATLDLAGQELFRLGHGLFNRIWVAAPASTRASDGLGPLYNARGCGSCHLKDGRGHPPEGPDDPAISMVLRLSVPDGSGGTMPDPTYGAQLQDFAAPGLLAEFRLGVSYTPVDIPLAGGEVVTLRRPRYHIKDLGSSQWPRVPCCRRALHRS